MRAHGFLVLGLLSILYLVQAQRTSILCYTGGGDSPYYVRMARSLARDFDLVMTPAELSHDGYFEDCPVSLEPRLLAPKNRYCWHPIGAPIVFAVPYALAGRLGILIFTALLAAGTVALLWVYLARSASDPAAALAATVTIGLSAPFLALAVNEYTEMPALLLQVAASLVLLGIPDLAGKPGLAGELRGRLLLLGLVLAALPWFHLRYAFISVALAVAASVRAPAGERRVMAWLAAPLALSVIGIYAWGAHATGTLSLFAPFLTSGSNRPGSVTIATLVTNGLWGHLTDQQGGLLVHAPLLALAVLGFAGMPALFAREVRINLGVSVPSFLLVASYYNWSGHWGVACRFLTPLLPLIGLGLTRAWRRIFDRLPGSLLPLIPFATLNGWVSYCWIAHPPLALSLENPNVNLDSVFVYLFRRSGVSLLSSFPRFIYTPSIRDYGLALSLLALTMAWLVLLHRVLERQRWQLALVVAVSWLLIHFEAAESTRPMRDPLSEDARWLSLDHRYLLTYPRFFDLVAAQSILQKKPDKAIRALERLIEVKPDHLDAYTPLVDLLAARRPRRAEEVCEQGIRVATARIGVDSNALYYRALLRFLAGRFKEARDDLEEYLRKPGFREREARTLLGRLSPTRRRTER
ncbi:MAG: hypothetical protein HY815_09270 [Candidatus Riflebacteria bacterium]|nr:hypothetical protein [Candidatus Riflebacteria bacterium]